jgi:phage antirepressor YoqD-like protein
LKSNFVDKRFEISYQSLIRDIAKIIKLDEDLLFGLQVEMKAQVPSLENA